MDLHGLHLLFDSRPQTRQMPFVLAGAQVGGNRHLGRRRATDVGHGLDLQRLAVKAPRYHPADPIAGGDGFGKGRTEQHQTLAIETLIGTRPPGTEAEVAVDVVFNKRHFGFGQQSHHLLFGAVVGQAAVGIVEIGAEDTGADIEPLQRLGNVSRANAIVRPGRDLDGAQTAVFQQLQKAVVSRRLDENVVSRPGHSPQRDV